MSYLLDTHTFLWWITDDSRLSAQIREIVSDPQQEVYFSSVNAFEIAVKAALGRLTEIGDPFLSVPHEVEKNYFKTLTLTVAAALRVYSLPPLHTDPFDRLLIAQAAEHDLTIITRDPLIQHYEVAWVW